jgi:RHS repeat-associated protein
MTDLYESVFYYNEQTQKLLQNDPLDYWYGNDLQNQMYRLNLPEHLRRHNLQVPVYKDDSPEHGSRDDEGRITHVQQTPLSYHHDLLLSLGNINFYYEHNGHLKIACPKSMGLNPVNLWSQCLIYLDEDTFVVKGHLVIRERINQQVIGFWIDQTFMPAVSDHLGSIKAIFSTSGDRVVLSREYSAWGMKQEKIYTPHAQERALVKLIPWSFAGLIEPFSVFADKYTPTLYWSQSRVYSPYVREWLTVDPMVKMDPQSLVEMPGNWNAVEYASGDPVNLVDPSGHFVLAAAAAGAGTVVIGGAALAGGASLTTGAALVAAPIIVGGFIVGSLMIAAAPTASLYIGTQMALNPVRTSIACGITSAILDRSFDMQTGFPSMDPYHTLAERITNSIYNFADSFKSSNFEKHFDQSSNFRGSTFNFDRSNKFDATRGSPDLGFFKGTNPYSN